MSVCILVYNMCTPISSPGPGPSVTVRRPALRSRAPLCLRLCCAGSLQVRNS